jgi:hypothetical protein
LCAEKDTRFGSLTIIPSKPVAGSSSTTACASSFGEVILKTATVYITGPNGKQIRAILFLDDGSHRTWIKRQISKELQLKIIQVEQITTRAFRQTEAPPAETHNVVEMTVRGTWPGAPTVRIEALEATDKVGSTGPYQTTEFARKLWLENENLSDDRFERDGGDEDVGILVGMDQMFNIMFNEPATISPCGLRAYTSKLGKVIGGPSQEKSSKQSQTIVSQLLINSNALYHRSPHSHRNFSTASNQTSHKAGRQEIPVSFHYQKILNRSAFSTRQKKTKGLKWRS